MTRAGCRGDGIKQRAGRPCGFLAAWLAASDVPTKDAHWDRELLLSLSQEERLARRTGLLMEAGGEDLLAFERPLRSGEPDEPADLLTDGYVRL